MNKYLLLLFILLPVHSLCAQDSLRSQRSAIITNFVGAYNSQNFPALFAIFPEKISNTTSDRKKEIEANIQKEESLRFNEFGKAHIDSIYSETANRWIAKLSYEKDRDEVRYLVMYFIGDTMVGMGAKGPEFNYPKVSASTLSASALTAKQSKLDNLITHKFIADGFNGCILVLADGKPVYNKSVGYADLKKKTPLNDSSVFELASCSKQFTAMGIMILAEQGKLKVSDSVKKFIPDLPYSGITIENLLTHTSGLPDYMQEMDAHWDKKKFATNYDIIETFKKDTPAIRFTPNQKFEYSNTGYAMLSVIIEKASGMSYGAFLQKYIFTPLKMTHSRVYNTRRSKGEIIPNYAYGYVREDDTSAYLLPDSVGELDMVRYLDAITGDGSVNSTILDLAKWEEGLYTTKLVSKSTLQQAYTRHILASGKKGPYGYGFFIQDDPASEPIAYHSGGWPGYCTFLLHDEAHDRNVIILSNNSYEGITEMADKIAKILVK